MPLSTSVRDFLDWVHWGWKNRPKHSCHCSMGWGPGPNKKEKHLGTNIHPSLFPDCGCLCDFLLWCAISSWARTVSSFLKLLLKVRYLVIVMRKVMGTIFQSLHSWDWALNAWICLAGGHMGNSAPEGFRKQRPPHISLLLPLCPTIWYLVTEKADL